MPTCASCGEENPDRFRLCGFCGTPLHPEEAPREIRKTVTIVFSDLVGSTAIGERLGPELTRFALERVRRDDQGDGIALAHRGFEDVDARTRGHADRPPTPDEERAAETSAVLAALIAGCCAAPASRPALWSAGGPPAKEIV